MRRAWATSVASAAGAGTAMARGVEPARRIVPAQLAADVRASLSQEPKQLPSKYLYDPLGSALFDAICRLPWYEVTRAEQRLLARHAADIMQAANPALVVELGPGDGQKLSALVSDTARARAAQAQQAQLPQHGPLAQPQPNGHAPANANVNPNVNSSASAEAMSPLELHLIDISAAALARAADTLHDLPHARVVPIEATYEQGIAQLAARRPVDGPAMVVFLGSNIGNFDPPNDAAFLATVRAALRPGDTLLLGADLVKPEAQLGLAYDDPLGVTAAFNKNLLARLNAELGATFALDRFAHRAVWRSSESRIEMHLVSLGDQRVEIPGARFAVSFADGEHIWTESSYKYQPETIERLGRFAGFTRRAQWIDHPGRFALTLFSA